VTGAVRTWADRLDWLLLTACGLGAAPVAPGTFGTLGGVVPAVILGALLDGAPLALTLSGLAAVLFVLGCTRTAAIRRLFGTEDPGAVVLDEVVGYLVVIALDTVIHGRPLPWTHALAFAAFRVFDVLKPPPVRRVEELPGAFGVMADDVIAAVYAALVLTLLHAIGLP